MNKFDYIDYVTHNSAWTSVKSDKIKYCENCHNENLLDYIMDENGDYFCDEKCLNEMILNDREDFNTYDREELT